MLRREEEGEGGHRIRWLSVEGAGVAGGGAPRPADAVAAAHRAVEEPEAAPEGAGAGQKLRRKTRAGAGRAGGAQTPRCRAADSARCRFWPRRQTPDRAQGVGEGGGVRQRRQFCFQLHRGGGTLDAAHGADKDQRRCTWKVMRSPRGVKPASSHSRIGEPPSKTGCS